MLLYQGKIRLHAFKLIISNSAFLLLVSLLLLQLIQIADIAKINTLNASEISVYDDMFEDSYPKDIADESHVSEDPLHIINRFSFGVYRILDVLFLNPTAHVYKDFVPEYAQDRIGSAVKNLSGPVQILNSAIQLDNDAFSNSAGRFLVNTTIGVAGFFDVATLMGIPDTSHIGFEDTFKKAGIGRGYYAFNPVLGPRHTRSFIAGILDVAANPLTWISGTGAYRFGVTGVHMKAQVVELEESIYNNSLDTYASMKSYYDQYAKDQNTNSDDREAVEYFSSSSKFVIEDGIY